MGLTTSTNRAAVTPIPDDPLSSLSPSSSTPSSGVSGTYTPSAKISSASALSPRMSSTRTRQKNKVPVVRAYHASIEESSSEEQGFTASSRVDPPPASDGRKKKVATVMDEPWKELTVNLHQLVNAQPVNQFATAVPSMPSLHKQLFCHTVDLLNEYKDQQKVDKDKSLMKDAQVEMSCVLNTMSPRAVQHFVNNGENDVITRAMDRATISAFEQHACLVILSRYLQVLQQHDVQYLARKLVRDRHDLQTPYDLNEPLPEKLQKQDKVLEILQYLCQVVSSPSFVRKDASENDALIVWAHVLGLAHSNDHITLQSGERMLEASKVLRQQQATEFGDLCDAGRKVDLVFVHKGIELSNIEFKRPGISAMDITVQCRKNIRLGRCIQEQHRKYGVTDPSVIMGDVAGFVGFFYQLAKMGEVWIVGATSPSTVHLPTTEGEFEMFLESTSLAQIFNFMEHLENEAPKIKRLQERYSRETEIGSFAQAVASPRPTTPPPKRKPFDQNVTFSPRRKHSL
ncbi:hypothetical protein EC991_010030 [Linnemannia zychae]|nr:hypothetical protein EC991_010030 [Linnemannia zychae]